MKHQILFVDDDALFRKAMTIFLKDEGYSVTSVSNGDEAIALVRQNVNQFSLALVDYNMPELSGYETIKKINYPMLADPTGHLSRAFGVHIEEAGLAYRGTFVVNPEGVIKIAEIQDNGIGRNADELLRKVQAAQFIATNPNEVCPAKWTPGANTLKPGLNLVGKI